MTRNGQFDDSSHLPQEGASPELRVPAPGKVTLTERLGPVLRRATAAAMPGPIRRRGGGAVTDPRTTFRRATTGAAVEVPYRQEMEQAFGEDFRGVRSFLGQADAMTELGASAAAQGEDLAFASHLPDRDTVAHELAHVVQHRRGTTGGAELSAPGDAAETDADQAAAAVVAGRPAIIGAASSAAIHRSSPAPAAGVTPPPPPALQHPPGQGPEKGDNEHKQIGAWERYTPVRTTTTIGLYNSEAEALAAAHSMGAVILEKGRYAAYHITTDAWVTDFTWENCQVLRSGSIASTWSLVAINTPWLAVTTQDGIVLRPSMHDQSQVSKVMTPERMLQPGANPFAGFDKLLGPTSQLKDEKLIEAFTAAMKRGAFGILEKSEQEVARKRDQYQRGQTGPDEFKTIRATAKKLDVIDDRLSTLTSLTSLPTDPKDSDIAEQRRKRDEYRREMEKLRQERQVVLNDYPMLARQDPKAIVAADDAKISQLLGDDTIQISKDIVDTRNNLLTGDLDVWGIESLIDTTIAGCGITDPERRKAIKDHAASLKKWNTVKTVVKTVFAIGLGLIASFATGGLALVAAAGALGLSTYDAMKATQDYAVDGAAANTSLDPRLSLAFQDMDHRWIEVAVAWVAVGLDVGSVASALKGVKSIEEVGQAATQLAKGSEDLLGKLRVAAGILKDGELVTESTRGVMALKLGTSLELRHGLGTEIRVLYEIEEGTGKVVVKGVVCGEKALAKDVLAHSETVHLLTRYEGVSGKLRELWERMLSIAGHKGGDALKNPFTPGSQAFESWLETKKLPGIIKDRVKSLESGAGFLTKEAEEGLRREIKVLEDDLARHQTNVDRLAAEQGTGFVAKSEEATKAAKAAGYPFPGPPQIPAEHAQYYYYRRNGSGYELCTMQDAPAGVKRFTIQGEGASATLIEGTPSAAQKAKLLVDGWSAERQAAFATLSELEQQGGVYRVVPLQGVGKTPGKIGDAFTTGQRAQMIDLYKRAWKAKNPTLTDKAAADAAKATVDKLMGKDVTLVQGTEPLRLFDYAKKSPAAKGIGEPIGELHHDIPLYLGGDHTLLTDIGKVKNAQGEVVDLHDELHALINQAKFKDGSTLAPTDLAKKIPTQPGAAVLKTDGTIEYYVFQGDQLVKVP
jgi:hypothetical protein